MRIRFDCVPMIPHIVAEFNTKSQDPDRLGRTTHPHIDLVSFPRQLYAQVVDDDALRGDLEDLLVLDAEKLRQTITVDLDAAGFPDDQAAGQVL